MNNLENTTRRPPRLPAAANQLVSSTAGGVTTRYAYDAAGRLVREGSKTYRYGWLDKVLSVTDGDMTRG